MTPAIKFLVGPLAFLEAKAPALMAEGFRPATFAREAGNADPDDPEAEHILLMVRGSEAPAVAPKPSRPRVEFTSAPATPEPLTNLARCSRFLDEWPMAVLETLNTEGDLKVTVDLRPLEDVDRLRVSNAFTAVFKAHALAFDLGTEDHLELLAVLPAGAVGSGP